MFNDLYLQLVPQFCNTISIKITLLEVELVKFAAHDF